MYTVKMPVHPLSRRERDGPLRVIGGGRLANDKVQDIGWFQTGIGSETMINWSVMLVISVQLTAIGEPLFRISSFAGGPR